MADRQNILASLINRSAELLSFMVPHGMIVHASLFMRRLRWHSFKRKLRSLGAGSYIDSPFSITNPQYIEIGRNFSSQAGFLMEAVNHYAEDVFKPMIIIGDNVSFYHNCHVACIDRIDIGNNVLFGSRVYITDHYHGRAASEDLERPPVARKLYSKGPVVIKNNAWIGEGVAIMPGVTIGENAIIGANSVVTRDIPPNAVAAGAPAKVIRTL